MSIKLQNITLTYLEPKSFVAVGPLNLEFPPSRVSVIIGPSGSGKSSLLRCLAGLLPDSSSQVTGSIVYDVAETRCRRSIAFQEDALLPWLDVRANVKLPVQLLEDRTADARCEHLLEISGLRRFAYYRPHALSGGMKQRANLIRALSTNPEWVFLDEPFGSLDAQTRYSLGLELLSMQRLDRNSMVLVTHDLIEAMLLGDVIFKFDGPPLQLVATEDVGPDDVPWEVLARLVVLSGIGLDIDNVKSKVETLKKRQT